MALPDKCKNCGFKYDDLRTGETFASIRNMLWVDDSDSSRWRHKRRGSVLGFWHELKQGMWREHLEMCKEAK